ncbi:hypothetical protein D3C78_1936740 [compost metagenome]
MVGDALPTTLPTAGLGGLPPTASRMRSTCTAVIGARPSLETTAGGAAAVAVVGEPTGASGNSKAVR